MKRHYTLSRTVVSPSDSLVSYPFLGGSYPSAGDTVSILLIVPGFVVVLILASGFIVVIIAPIYVTVVIVPGLVVAI